MKVLVTGGTGFVGSALVRHLIEAKYEVRVLVHYQKNRFLLEGLDVEIANGDVTRPAAVRRAVKDCSVVFDIASAYTFYPFWEKEAKALYRVNVQGTVNLLNAAMTYGVERYIHTSSIATIGKRPDGKLSDETTEFDFDTASHYARSKYLAEQEVLKFCKRGLPAIILNPAIVIGERDHKPTPSGDVIVKFLNRSFPGYFDAVWSVADADDVARAHIDAIKRGRIGERYILCNKKHHRLKDIFKILEKISGVKAPRLKIPSSLLFCFVYLDEIMSHFVFRKRPLLPSEGVKFCMMSIEYDNSKAVRELGYASAPIEETLAKAVSWYRKNGYIAPRGVLRIKAHGSRAVKFLMRKLGMDKYTDKLNLGTWSYFFTVRFLQYLIKVGLRPSEDGWRKVTQCYLRTEHSKFALAVFGLNFMSDLKPSDATSLTAAKRHALTRLMEFLRQEPRTHYQLTWKPFSVEKEVKKSIDFVHAEFEDSGALKDIAPSLDLNDENGSDIEIPSELRSELLQGIITIYNKTRNLGDKFRPLILKRELRRWLLRQSRLNPGIVENQKVHIFIDRILSADFIQFERLKSSDKGQNSGRFQVPTFIRCKHPGFGLMNIVCRFDAELKEVDLWFQFNHIPIDGVPAQEVLNDLKKAWNQNKTITFPGNEYDKGMTPVLCSTREGKKGVYHVNRFVDFKPFLTLRRELNRRCAGQLKGAITTAALLIWKMAQYREFEDIKFTVPVDLRATVDRERTLGFVFIRPAVYLDRNKPDRGFFDFQHEFNRQLRGVRKRQSEGYDYLECLALAPPWMYSATAKLMGPALRDFGGTVGITIIKKADFFIAPYSDVHRDGFIAFSSYSLPSEKGGRVGLVSIKGPKEKIQRYLEIIDEIINYSVKDDELYF